MDLGVGELGGCGDGHSLGPKPQFLGFLVFEGKIFLGSQACGACLPHVKGFFFRVFTNVCEDTQWILGGHWRLQGACANAKRGVGGEVLKVVPMVRHKRSPLMPTMAYLKVMKPVFALKRGQDCTLWRRNCLGTLQCQASMLYPLFMCLSPYLAIVCWQGWGAQEASAQNAETVCSLSSRRIENLCTTHYHISTHFCTFFRPILCCTPLDLTHTQREGTQLNQCLVT